MARGDPSGAGVEVVGRSESSKWQQAGSSYWLVAAKRSQLRSSMARARGSWAGQLGRPAHRGGPASAAASVCSLT